MAAITPEKKFAIHRAVNIDGLTFNQAAKFFQISSPVEVKAICEEVSKDNEDRFTTRGEHERAFQTERKNEIYARAMRKWDKSEEPTTETFVDKIIKKKVDEDGVEHEVVVGRKERTVVKEGKSDPRWGALALRVTESVLNDNGWTVPKQLNVSHDHLHEIRVSLRGKTREELTQIAQVEMLTQQGVIRIMDKNIPKPVEATVIEKKEEPKKDATPF